MRICHVGVEIVPSSSGAYVGGLAKSVGNLCRMQQMSGHSVDLVTTDVNGTMDTFEGQGSMNVRRIHSTRSYGSPLFALQFLRGAASQIKELHRQGMVDLVHVHSAYSSVASIAYMMGGLEVPKVFSLYSFNLALVSGHSCNGNRIMGQAQLARALLKKFDLTLVPSDRMFRQLAALGVGGSALQRLSPVLDPGMFHPMPTKEVARQILGIPQDRFVFIFLGNFSKWKGAEVLLRAMKLLHRSHEDLLLLAAWGEPYQWSGNQGPEILSLIKTLGLEGIVRSYGMVEDIGLLLSAADVLASPFTCLCKVLDYPLSIMESLACGTPVIASRLGGIPEILDDGKTGLLVTPGDEQSLARAMESLIDDRGWARAMGVDGAREMRRCFEPHETLRKLDEHYQGLLKASAPARVVTGGLRNR